MTRQFTEHELAMQNFDAMREEEFLRAFDAIYDTIIAALDEARANFENDNDIEVKEMFPGTMAALDDLKERFTPEEIEQERDWHRYKEDYLTELDMRMNTVREDDGE